MIVETPRQGCPIDGETVTAVPQDGKSLVSGNKKSKTSPVNPKVFILRHGQTEWSEIGKRTSFTDLPLTEKGRTLVQRSASTMLGTGKLIDPSKLRKVYVSPRLRAQETLKLLDLPESVPVETTELLREFEYGEFEGMKTSDIKKLTGNDKWETWIDPAPGGETPQQVSDRIDELIDLVRTRHHQLSFEHEEEALEKPDILFVAHGHILRGLGARWIRLDIRHARGLQLDAGGVGVLAYEHGSIEEPAITRWNLIQ
ncbi:histidine phosphatase superfamily [Protomyces lactucae-debilis]|uniref:Histidine phosphatase superfamily n=1 Tax=Protomyces lactucae-debilis TaxID=2754530 RepID=A0A1Y2FBZ2_PROLT|nr:histidine phosphatase superfamily [Protomyces lactucae-debilis]ORY81432.1 histidine phosphatase superfamily [Protomyces lactucae-debilis]